MRGNYRIEVQDFGPITHAEVDVRPLTIFIGPSNTGKSYLATLIYALHQCFGGPDAWRSGGRFVGQEPFFLPFPARAPQALRKQVLTWVTGLSPKSENVEVPSTLTHAVLPSINDPRELAEHLKDRLQRYFGPVSSFVRNAGSSSCAKVGFSVCHEALAEPAHYRFALSEADARVSVQLPSLDRVRLDPQALERLGDMVEFLPFWDEQGQQNAVLGSLSDVVFRSILRPLCRDAYYFPTDRPGLMQSHQVIAGGAIQQASTAALRPQTSVPMLSGVLADFLDQLLRIDRPTGRMRVESQRLDERLQRLLDGEIRLSRAETSYPRFSYRPSGWKRDLPLFRASSMVSELAPVVLYLRYAVSPGDVIIIDEPEAHLHPAMQAAFACELARLVCDGVRVVMTTHSEWFVEKIGNLVRASSLPPERRDGVDTADAVLKPEDVGAWLFRPKKRPKGSAVEEIKLDPDTGLYPTDYDAVSMALYNEGARIFNRMQEEEAG